MEQKKFKEREKEREERERHRYTIIEYTFSNLEGY